MSRVIDLTKEKFGRLVVLERKDNDKFGRSRWLCQCDCGNLKTIDSRHLRQGNVNSCGCLQKEMVSERMTSHGLTKDNKKLINIWCAMKSRCEDVSNRAYKNYGERGISVCDSWGDVEVFIKWSNNNGYEENLTLDRIDNDGNYEPSNCRWVSMEVQANNKSNNVSYTIDGVTKTRSEWCREYKLPYDRVRGRLRLGWSIEEALEITER